jgi:hypothetical protein
MFAPGSRRDLAESIGKRHLFSKERDVTEDTGDAGTVRIDASS